MTRVAIFTDNDFGKVNGVTTTLRAVLAHQPHDLSVRVYTAADRGSERDDYFAARSIGTGLPWYSQMKIYWPRHGVLSREMRRVGADVVHLTTPGPVGLAARFLAASRRLPMVGSFHTNLGEYAGILSGSAALKAAMDRYMRWLYRPCATVLAPSAATATELAAGGYRPEALSVWSRGVDTSAFSPERRSMELRFRWGVASRTPVVLYAGRLSREKGLGLLPQILGSLRDAATRYRLVFAGTGPMLEELRQQFPTAMFLGEVRHEEMGAIMASADILLFPSATDTFGNVVLEAQASGLPVIVSDRGGPREAMVSGQTGIVCRAGCVTDFADAVATLVTNLGHRRELSADARAYALTRSWNLSLQPLFDAWRGAKVHA